MGDIYVMSRQLIPEDPNEDVVQSTICTCGDCPVHGRRRRLPTVPLYAESDILDLTDDENEEHIQK